MIRLLIGSFTVAMVAMSVAGCGSGADDSSMSQQNDRSVAPGAAQTDAARANAAMAAIHQVQDAVESCAASDINGSYASCGGSGLAGSGAEAAIAPSVPEAGGSCDVSQAGACVNSMTINGSTYDITAITSGTRPITFTFHKTDSSISKTCAPTGAGCESGTW